MLNEFQYKESDIFNVRWCENPFLFAAGSSSSVCDLYTQDFKKTKSLACQLGQYRTPITSIRFRPQGLDPSQKPSVLVTVSDGGITQWNPLNGRRFHLTRLNNQEIFTSDYDLYGTKYVVGCNNGILKVFDANTNSNVQVFRPVEEITAQRVFCTKWFNEYNILSAGWDNKISVWDARTGIVCRTILGPHVCGDSVDVKENYIVSGSYNVKDQVQVWDFGSGKNIYTISIENNGLKCLVYSLQFCKNFEGLFAVGGAEDNKVHFFNAATMEKKGVIDRITKPIYSLNWSLDNKLAIGAGSSALIYLAT